MSKRILAGLTAAAALAITIPTSAQAQMNEPQSEVRTISGTVVDVSCKFGHGLGGADHRMCSQVCANKGIPLAILGDDGQLYMLVSTGMPGKSQNDLLKEYAEQKVTVSGKVFAAVGASAIQIEKVTRESCRYRAVKAVASGPGPSASSSRRRCYRSGVCSGADRSAPPARYRRRSRRGAIGAIVDRAPADAEGSVNRHRSPSCRVSCTR